MEKKVRKRQTSEEIFYTSLKNLIENQLINDPNFRGDWNRRSWYEENNKMHYGLFQEKAKYIIDKMEEWKHLIIDEEPPVVVFEQMKEEYIIPYDKEKMRQTVEDLREDLRDGL